MPEPKETLRKDYLPADFKVNGIDLIFELGEEETLVHTSIDFERSEPEGNAPLVLTGEEMELLSLTINDEVLTEDRYVVDKETLKIEANTPLPFTDSNFKGVFAIN